MTLIAWNESHPSDSSLVAQAPTYVRNVWKNIAVGLATSLYWPGSGGGSDASQGCLRPGATKAFFAADSAASHPGTGYAMMTSDTSVLFFYDRAGSGASSSTVRIGSPFIIEHATGYAGPPATRWVQQNGSFATDTKASATIIGGVISFPIAYDGIPSVHVFSDVTTHLVAAPISGIATNLFTSQVSGSASTHTYRWVSLGTITPT